MSSYQLEYVALTLVTNVTNRLAHVRRRHFLTDLFIYQQTNLSEHNVTMTTTVSSSLTWAKLARQIFLRTTSSVIGAELWRPNLSSYVAPPLNRLDGRTKKVSFLTFYSKINIRVTLKSNIFIKAYLFLGHVNGMGYEADKSERVRERKKKRGFITKEVCV